MTNVEKKLNAALALVDGYNTQKAKLIALHNKTSDPNKLGAAERVFLAEVLAYDSAELMKRNLNKLTCNYWQKLQSEMDFAHNAPERFCGDFFYSSQDVIPFDKENVTSVISDAFSKDKSQLIANIKAELENWSIGTQKQGKYRFVLSNLPLGQIHFSSADKLIFNLFQYLSNNMDEVIDWRNKVLSGEYSDLMMVFNSLIEIKLHKRGAISLEFSKRLASALEADLIDATVLKAA